MFESRLAKLTGILDEQSIVRLKNSAVKAQRIENKWDAKVRRAMEQHAREIARAVQDGRPMPELDLLPVFVEHYFESAKAGYVSAETREYTKKLPYGAQTKPGARLAKKKRKGKVSRRQQIPRKLSDLMDLWSEWRKKKYIPKRQQVLADKIQRAYQRKVKSVWEKYSEDFREGRSFTQGSVVRDIMRVGKAEESTAKRVVREETTRYYNEARRRVYDQSGDVTHYLYMSIRDHATTKWCKTRHGIVYTKGTRFLEEETPPNHWNCRSEILPLTPKNPTHLRLINDLNRKRSRRRPEPLPKEFKKRVA